MDKCETCLYYEYDYNDGCGYCTADMDMDELASLYSNGSKDCKLYRAGDDYTIVRHQL